MEFSFATIIPAIVVVFIFMIICYLVKWFFDLTLRGVGWLVLNGYWFPKTMREQRDTNIANTEADIRKLNKIIYEEDNNA